MAEVAKKVTGLGGITLALRPNEYPLVIEYRTSGFLKWRVVKSFGSAGVNEKRRFRTRKQAERYVARRTWSPSMTPPAPTPEQPKHRADGPARVFVGAKVGGKHRVGVPTAADVHYESHLYADVRGCLTCAHWARIDDDLAAAARVAEDERRAL